MDEEVDEGIWIVGFMHHDLGYIDLEQKTLQPLDNPYLSSHVATADDPRIPAPVDVAMVVNTYHNIGQRDRYFSRLKKSLKPQGRVAIIDFKPESPVGPPKRHGIAANAVTEEMTRAGYALEASPDFLPDQYLLIFRPR